MIGYLREYREWHQIIALRLMMRSSVNFYPFYFQNGRTFPYEIVSVRDTRIRAGFLGDKMDVPRGSSPYDSSLPWPTGSWKLSAIMAESDPAAAICLATRKETLDSLLNNFRKNYCCSMEMGFPS